MGNAEIEVKDYAKYTTDTNLESGVGKPYCAIAEDLQFIQKEGYRCQNFHSGKAAWTCNSDNCQNEKDIPCFDGWSLGNKGDALSLYAMNGDLVAHIKQISLTFGTRFELYKEFEKVGTMQKIFNWPGDFIIFVDFTGQSKVISIIINIKSIISISKS